ncbi:MAG TPA: hypothetical protein VF764_06260 [Steroidobacteraceae bacterium]
MSIDATGHIALLAVGFIASVTPAAASAAQERWSEQQARDWYARQPLILGANYIPATAINQLEMWQADTFDPQRIDLELGWAEAIGMNTMRVFLHDLLWQQDASGFRTRIDTFLEVAARHHIRTLFVLFDSVWDPSPHLGPQHPPVPGVHNSGWVQSPGAAALSDPSQYARLESYVKGVVGAFARDQRILGWDVWNEPPYSDKVGGSYAALESHHKGHRVRALLPKVFMWARAAGATQPLTSGVWGESWEQAGRVSGTPLIQLEESDIISFHSYDRPAIFEERVVVLSRYHRPLICTEYMARSAGSTFEDTLPIARKYHVGAINWGLVAGKTQTIYPWDSWQKPYDHEPTPWFHDIFRTDGRPYDPKETALIREMSGVNRAAD